MNLCKITKIAEDVYVFTDTSLGWYYNSTVILTNEGPIVIDVFSDEKMFNEVIDFINQRGFSKPTVIIYTHWHSDHTTGNRIFKDGRIIAHSSTINHLKHLKNKLIAIGKQDLIPIMPTETFDDGKELIIGNKLLQLYHCPGHTYDSILVYDEQNRIIIAGDNLVGKEVEFWMPPLTEEDEEDSNSSYLEEMFRIIEEFEADIIIPGHGAVVASKELIALNKSRYQKCLLEKIKNTK